ncbi:MAG TPA: alpha-L-rhamnosidase C-terminal domain-containing protein [Chitinophagaceae bacterium]|nr:alpha-L-rhamnosidase C-terminal domain-containing protein [Chitinophagaceae bacterium]
MQNRRTERGMFYPVFWKVDSHYPLMNFHKYYELSQPEEIEIYTEGEYNVRIDGNGVFGNIKRITVPAGKHKLSIKVFNQASVPAVYVKGKTIVSDSSWSVSYDDKEWVDETGKRAQMSAALLKAGQWNLNSPSQLPSVFMLPTVKKSAVSAVPGNNSLLIDFGKETFGFITLHGLSGKGNLSLYYGESKEEALAVDRCETFDRLHVNNTGRDDSTLKNSKAFRYVNVQYDGTISIDSVSMLYEYANLKERGSFTCNDEEINRIYDISKYTFELNTREFFIDGIKRDRWVWSGDAYQSYLMNYYLYFDNATVTRTALALRGKEPVVSHINTIMDYTLYWFLGIYDYYLYTGDKAFIQQFYPRMQSLMEYVFGRLNKNGLLEGLPGDWIFIDWADGLSKEGEISFEQLLLARSLETMALCAGLVGDSPGTDKYSSMATDLRKKLFDIYWSEQKQAMVHSRVNGKPTDNVTRYANMFAIFFDYFNAQQKQAVKQSVLLNNNVQKITTPYMRFYELEALCAMGEQNYVLKEMKDYWGGMLKLGATSFWELYDPTVTGEKHYAMYGRDFGKSLCHAWGASPIYLLGKYYLGIKPTSPGYASYVIEPNLGGLQWMQGKVPTPKGDIEIYVSKEQVKITGAAGTGSLKIKSKTAPKGKNILAISKGGNNYEVVVQPGMACIINYKAI